MPWFAVALPLALLLAAVSWQARRSTRTLDAARADGAAMRRATHLAALDLRDVTLRLHGLIPSDPAAPGTSPLAETLAALAARCRRLGDDLGAIGPSRQPTIRPEPLDLGVFAHDAATAIAAIVAPGHRHLHIAAPPGGNVVLADARAVREVLRRVLGEAVLHTRQADWITVTLAPCQTGGLSLTVADEGTGLPTPSPGAPGQPDSRGVGASLALARTLMAAHGGTLDVEAALGTGTKVSLWFPPAFDEGHGGNRLVAPCLSSS